MAGFLTLILEWKIWQVLNFDIGMEDMAGFLTLILEWKIWQVS